MAITMDRLKYIDLFYLTEKESIVMEYRYGLEEHEKLSFNKIALIIGVTKERVRQIEKSALKRMREQKMEYLKDSVNEFKNKMFLTMIKNIDKGGWQGFPEEYFTIKLKEEFNEVMVEIKKHDSKRTCEELVDLANICMMYHDILQERIKHE